MELYDDSDLSVVKQTSDNYIIHQSYNPKLLPTNLQYKHSTVKTSKLKSKTQTRPIINSPDRRNKTVTESYQSELINYLPFTFEDEYKPEKPNNYYKIVRYRQDYTSEKKYRHKQSQDMSRDAYKRVEKLDSYSSDDLDEDDEGYNNYLLGKLKEIRSQKDSDDQWRINPHQDSKASSSGSQFGSLDQYVSAPLKKSDIYKRRPYETSVNQSQDERCALTETRYGEFAAKMMTKYGFKDGEGLGKHNQGIAAALKVKHIHKNFANIVEDEEKPRRVVQDENKTTNEKMRNQSKVVLLLNMVGPNEIDAELEQEIKEECESKYGVIEKLHICEDQAKNVPKNRAVRIFVEFKRIESAVKALIGLDKRYFGGRVVNALFYDVDLFKKGYFFE